MKKCFLLAFSLFIFTAAPLYSQDINDSVIKILVTNNRIDYYRPWQSLGMDSATGSGCVIKGNKIITNAHVVEDHTFIQVKKNNDPKKYTAKVEAIAHDADLALLTVDDPKFFEGTFPVPLGDLPRLQDTVVVLGYPLGGEQLSITEGVVSRIELTSYSQSSRKLLAVQIDAAINPGNSGGPVVQNGKLVGVAMQSFKTGQNIGYIIPVPIIQHVFDDLKDGTYDGFPLIGIDFATTENKAMREYYKIADREGGVLITSISPFAAAKNVLKEGDVIFEVEGTPIGEDATFEFRKNERLFFSHLITQKQMKDDLNLKVVRDGKLKQLSIKLTPFIPLVPFPNQFEEPSYYIYGGMVFTILSTDLLRTWGDRWWERASIDLTYYLMGKGRMNEKDKKEMVVLLNVLSDDVNVGYQDYGNAIISRVNGQEFDSFKEFVILLNKIKKTEKYTLIDTEYNSPLIINNKDIDKTTLDIIERNNIPAPYSKDVETWLKEGK